LKLFSRPCSVCLERLDTTAKVLPCQHTFCRRCLENIVSSRNELRCPECRILVGCEVDDLPANILLVRLLDGIKQRPRNGGSTSRDQRLSPGQWDQGPAGGHTKPPGQGTWLCYGLIRRRIWAGWLPTCCTECSLAGVLQNRSCSSIACFIT
uniref:SH3 domain containing ring finger 3 n=1 Tax=Salmo trutta TaxID=8032 RepID=A0A673XUY1_SALTR